MPQPPSQPPSQRQDEAAPPPAQAATALARAIVCLGFTQIIGWGTTYYLPAIFARRMAESLGQPVSLVLAAFAWAMLLSGLLSRRIGALIDRHGANRVMGAGSVIAACALAAQAFADNSITLWVAWTALGLAMRAILYDGAFAALTAIAGGGARRAISLLTLLGGLASSVFWPIGHNLLELFDWRVTLGIYAALNLLVCAPLHYFCAGPRRPHPRNPHHESTSRPAISGESNLHLTAEQRAARERVVWLLAALFAVHSLISAALAVHLPGLLKGLGLTAALAITAASIMGPAQVVARSIELLAQSRVSITALTVPVMVMVPIAFLPLLMAGDSMLAALVFVLVYGATNGLSTILRGALPLTLLGSRGYGELLGRIAGPGLVTAAIAPVGLEWVIDATSPQGAVMVLIGLGLGCALIARSVLKAGRRLD